jgi:hypothetical protein
MGRRANLAGSRRRNTTPRLKYSAHLRMLMTPGTRGDCKAVLSSQLSVLVFGWLGLSFRWDFYVPHRNCQTFFSKRGSRNLRGRKYSLTGRSAASGRMSGMLLKLPDLKAPALLENENRNYSIARESPEVSGVVDEDSRYRRKVPHLATRRLLRSGVSVVVDFRKK